MKQISLERGGRNPDADLSAKQQRLITHTHTSSTRFVSRGNIVQAAS